MESSKTDLKAFTAMPPLHVDARDVTTFPSLDELTAISRRKRLPGSINPATRLEQWLGTEIMD
jgi:hypothetical protein